MTNKMKVYTKIMEKFKKMMPQTPQNQMVTTTMMVAGFETTITGVWPKA
jgi:hypothetical protein